MQPIILDSIQPAQYAVIWLHGLGADGHDFESIVPELGLADCPIRFIFPHASKQPITLNEGMMMPAWYDFTSMDFINEVDWSGIQASQTMVDGLIQAQIQSGIASDRILLAGFSQGGVMALVTGLQFVQPLAGIMALSTYLPSGITEIKQTLDVPILQVHGEQDPICSLANAQQSYQVLCQLGFQPQWQTYPMAHQVCAPEIARISDFIRSCFDCKKEKESNELV